MDYGHPDLADRLAADYAVGTLRGGARRRFERLLPAHPALAAAAARWAERLHLLADRVEPVEPPAHVWIAIQRQLFGAANDERLRSTGGGRGTGTGSGTGTRALRAWQVLGSTALAASLVLGFLVVRPVEEPAPLVVVLQGTPAGLSLVKTGFVASVTPDGRALVLRPLGPVTIDPAHALELWAIPIEGSPRSLGLIQAGDVSTTVRRAGLLQGTKAFAVSLEPAEDRRPASPPGRWSPRAASSVEEAGPARPAQRRPHAREVRPAASGAAVERRGRHHRRLARVASPLALSEPI